MILIKRISIKDILYADNIDYLIEKYTEESRVATIKLDPKLDKDAYIFLEDNEMLHCIGVYSEDKLVGFMTLIINKVLHYSELSATVESQFILKEYRSHGAWKRLLTTAEEVAKENGAFIISMMSAIGTRFEKVMSKSGYTATNIAYTKSLI